MACWIRQCLLSEHFFLGCKKLEPITENYNVLHCAHTPHACSRPHIVRCLPKNWQWCQMHCQVKLVHFGYSSIWRYFLSAVVPMVTSDQRASRSRHHSSAQTGYLVLIDLIWSPHIICSLQTETSALPVKATSLDSLFYLCAVFLTLSSSKWQTILPWQEVYLKY